jgi:hypothetical protein
MKIQGIKILRDIVNGNNNNICGLAAAKFAIENWKQFVTYVRNHGFPSMDSNGSYDAWINK